jgi:hypothetical protein
MVSMHSLSVVHLGYEFKYNNLCGVMDSMLTLSVVHLGFEFKYNHLCGVMDSMLTNAIHYTTVVVLEMNILMKCRFNVVQYK